MTVERSDNFTDKGIRDRYEHDGREEISKRVVEHLYDTHAVSVSVPASGLNSVLPFNFTSHLFFLRLLLNCLHQSLIPPSLVPSLSLFFPLSLPLYRHGASGRGNALRNWELRAREVRP